MYAWLEKKKKFSCKIFKGGASLQRLDGKVLQLSDNLPFNVSCPARIAPGPDRRLPFLQAGPTCRNGEREMVKRCSSE